jgi:diaminohydroxyphosphoribosylaminopyrimidine deaminase/5-amino-6-(5-phosphoribosylamino)uracil reductase
VVLTTDLGHMAAALGLARRGLGSVWPNPSVGCVLVNQGRVVGRGRTAQGGRPHAETEALAQADYLARGATAYVTLEPCSHHGKTGPCAEALISAGVTRVVVATEDPDPRVSGRGLARLRDGGVSVESGLLQEEADEVIAGFRCRIETGKPLVTLKIAASLDGRTATHRGESQWITGETARARGHLLRAQADAIMIGSGTALIDDPLLTCRLPGLEGRSPVRVLVDGRLSLPLTSKLVASAEKTPLWLFTRTGNSPERLAALDECGVEVIETAPTAEGAVDLDAVLKKLGERGLTRLLVEAGGHLAAALLRHRLVDRLAWFQAPMLIGGDGLPAAVAFGIDKLDYAPRWRRLSAACLGTDMVEYLAKI